jgi:hypothetical protein
MEDGKTKFSELNGNKHFSNLICSYFLRERNYNDIGLIVNTKKTKYVILSRHQNANQDHNIKTDNKWFENVAKSQVLGILLV